MQIHAAEITDVRKAVEREKLSRQSLERHVLPHKHGAHRTNNHRVNDEYNSTNKKQSKWRDIASIWIGINNKIRTLYTLCLYVTFA